MKKNRFTYEGLNHEYHELDLSIAAIARKHGVSSQTVFRAIKSLGIRQKSKSEAHKAAIKSERFKHPMKGKKRDSEVKEKIARSMREYWRNKQIIKNEEGNANSK